MMMLWGLRISSKKPFVCHNAYLHPPPSVTPVALPTPEPMQIDCNHLTLAERQRRITDHLCLYCGGEGHILTNCPVRPLRPAVSTIQLPPQIAPLTRTTVYNLTRNTRNVTESSSTLAQRGTSSLTTFYKGSMSREIVAPKT